MYCSVLVIRYYNFVAHGTFVHALLMYSRNSNMTSMCIIVSDSLTWYKDTLTRFLIIIYKQ